MLLDIPNLSHSGSTAVLDASAQPPGPRLELKGRAAFFLPLHLQQLFKIIIIFKKILSKVSKYCWLLRVRSLWQLPVVTIAVKGMLYTPLMLWEVFPKT